MVFDQQESNHMGVPLPYIQLGLRQANAWLLMIAVMLIM
jgi:hypothetical protein